MGFWSKIWTTRAKDWIYAPLEANQVPDALQRSPIPSDGAYLSIFLKSMRVVNVRKGLSKFYGTVHSHISLPYIASTDPAEFQVVTTPNELAAQDADNVDRVVNFNQRLLGPIPYRGGDVGVEVGLFSIKTADLAKPFIDILQTMSSVAGVSFISAALPFVEPIKTGINLLTGGADESILEIGVSTTYDRPETGYVFVMRATKDEVDPATLKVDKDFRLVDSNGRSIKDFPYMVMALEASDRRDDWFQVPELSRPYKEVQDEVRKGDVARTQDAFAAFRRLALTSPDLLTRDAQRLVKKVEDQIAVVLQGALTSSSTAELPNLEKIALYDAS